jgi:ElaB/YqjD/DUF883 family membrane-anchored ribosome-binding protein
MDTNNYIDEKQLAEIEAKLKETKDKLEKIVHEYPLTSVAIAFGIGYAVARILGRGR